LAAGASTDITIPVTAKNNIINAFTNTAKVTSNEDATGKTATASVNVGASGFDLELASIADSPDPVNAPGKLTYTIIARNNGTSIAKASDGLKLKIDTGTSSGLSISGGDPAGTNGWTCPSAALPSFTCSGDLPGGGDTTIML